DYHLMPYKEEMNWDSNKRRWHRMHEGGRYVVSPRQLDQDKSLPRVHVYTRDGSRAAANLWWQRKEAELRSGPGPRERLLTDYLGQRRPKPVDQARLSETEDRLLAAAGR